MGEGILVVEGVGACGLHTPNTPLWPLSHWDGWSGGPGQINRLVSLIWCSYLFIIYRFASSHHQRRMYTGSAFSLLYTQVSGRLGMSGGISPRHAQNPLSGERRKTLSITHHALSPPPSHHHLYIIHLINWLQRFYRIIMSLKRPFVPKSDVKQWFTTTTSSLLLLFFWYWHNLNMTMCHIWIKHFFHPRAIMSVSGPSASAC